MATKNRAQRGRRWGPARAPRRGPGWPRRPGCSRPGGGACARRRRPRWRAARTGPRGRRRRPGGARRSRRAVIGPSTALTISRQADLRRAAGPARSRRRRPAWSAPARRPSGRAGSAPGRAGGARCARRCRAPRSGPARPGAARARAGPGRRSHLGSTLASVQSYGPRSSPATADRPDAPATHAALPPRQPDGGLTRPWRTARSSPTTPAPCLTNVVPSLLGPRPDLGPAGLVPGPVARRAPGRAARARRPRLGPARRSAGRIAPDAGGDGRAARSRTVAPSHDGHRAHLDRHRAHPGEHGVVGYRIAVDGEVLNVLRWTHRRRRRPPAHRARRGPAARRRSSAQRRAGGHQGRVRQQSGSPQAHLRRRAPRRLPRAVDAWPSRCGGLLRGRRAVRLRLLRRHRQGRPRVRPGRALRRRAARRRPAGGRRARRAARRTPRCWSPPTTARSTSATDVMHPDRRRAALTSPASRARAASAGCTPAPGRSRRPARRRDRELTRTGAWVVPRRAGRSTRAGSGRGSAPGPAGRLGDVAVWSPGTPVSFDDPADTGPFALVCRHGSLTSAEMLVPLLGSRGA